MQRSDSSYWKTSEVARLLALVESERRYYQDLLAALPVAVAVVGEDQSLVTVNREFKQRFGVSAESLSSLRVADLLPDPKLEQALAEVIAGGQRRAAIDIRLGPKRLRVALRHTFGWQDQDTGWFSAGNEALHFKEHATAYATGALALLGSRPRFPFRWAERITRSPAATERWLNSIWWDYVWVGSHQGGGVAAALHMTGAAPEEWFAWYLDWLDRECNPETGLWQRAFYNRFTTQPAKHDMGGAAHFWWIYQHRGRPIPHPEKVIDSLLGLQLPSGLWDRKPRKGDFPYCINCDAVNGLKLASLQLRAAGQDDRSPEVTASFERYLRRCQKVLTAPRALSRLYAGNSHDLPGAFIGIAEADLYFQAVEGKSRLRTSAPRKYVLETICWL
jgi:hypothetical protein